MVQKHNTREGERDQKCQFDADRCDSNKAYNIQRESRPLHTYTVKRKQGEKKLESHKKPHSHIFPHKIDCRIIRGTNQKRTTAETFEERERKKKQQQERPQKIVTLDARRATEEEEEGKKEGNEIMHAVVMSEHCVVSVPSLLSLSLSMLRSNV